MGGWPKRALSSELIHIDFTMCYSTHNSTVQRSTLNQEKHSWFCVGIDVNATYNDSPFWDIGWHYGALTNGLMALTISQIQANKHWSSDASFFLSSFLDVCGTKHPTWMRNKSDVRLTHTHTLFMGGFSGPTVRWTISNRQLFASAQLRTMLRFMQTSLCSGVAQPWYVGFPCSTHSMVQGWASGLTQHCGQKLMPICHGELRGSMVMEVAPTSHEHFECDSIVVSTMLRVQHWVHLGIATAIAKTDLGYHLAIFHCKRHCCRKRGMAEK